MFWKRFSHFRTIIFFGVLLSLPIVFLYVKSKFPRFQETVSSPILDMSLRGQALFFGLVSLMSDKLYAVSIALQSHEELADLRAQKQQLAELKIALTELESENLRLKELMDFSKQFGSGRAIGAQVIGRIGAPLTRIIQINKGKVHGLSRGDAVIGVGGAVGQILSVGKNHSDVLLVTDSTSTIDVLVQRTRAQGILNGAGDGESYRARVNDFDRLHEVQAGDVIVTSGIGARFPVGVPVGEVALVKPTEDSLYIVADVKPIVNFGTIEEVVVLTKGSPDNPWSRNELIMETLETSIASKGIAER